MVCKYCHSNSHLIDSCPTIICKLCKKVGHALWKCTEKNGPSKKITNQKEKTSTLVSQISKKPVIKNESTDFSKNSSDQKNIAFYLKHEKDCWSNYL